jgi:hypothetical protein
VRHDFTGGEAGERSARRRLIENLLRGRKPEYRRTAKSVNAPLAMMPAPVLSPSRVMILIVRVKKSAPNTAPITKSARKAAQRAPRQRSGGLPVVVSMSRHREVVEHCPDHPARSLHIAVALAGAAHRAEPVDPDLLQPDVALAALVGLGFDGHAAERERPGYRRSRPLELEC